MNETVVQFHNWPLYAGFLRCELFTQTNPLLTVPRFDWRLVVLAHTYRNNRKFMRSVRSEGGHRAVVGFVAACLLLFVSALWLVNYLLLASYWCSSGASRRASLALRFFAGLDRSAD